MPTHGLAGTGRADRAIWQSGRLGMRHRHRRAREAAAAGSIFAHSPLGMGASWNASLLVASYSYLCKNGAALEGRVHPCIRTRMLRIHFFIGR